MKKVNQDVRLERDDDIRCNSYGLISIYPKSVTVRFSVKILIESGDLIETIEEKLLRAIQKFGNDL